MIRFYAEPGDGIICAAAAKLHACCFAKNWSATEIALLLAKSGGGLLVDARPEAEQNMRGFILFRHMAGEAEILTLCIAREHRRAGIGARLVFAMLAYLLKNGINEVFLEVMASNAAALDLYNRCGFSKTGLRRNYYGSGRDGVIMRFSKSFEETGQNC